MEIFLPSDELRALEAFAEAGGMSQMKMIRTAGKVAAEYIRTHYAPCRVLVLCGTGNNCADGMIVASILCGDYTVSVYQPTLARPDSYAAKARDEATKKGCTFPILLEFEKYDLIIDAFYGIGFHLPLTDSVAAVFRAANESCLPIVSLDIPSGVEADTGAAARDAIRAECTLTFTKKKIALMAYPGADYAGNVVLLDAGIPVPDGMHSSYSSLTDLSLYPARKKNSHKGTFGTLALFAGSVGMAGAAYLSALAAYRTGVGMVKIITPEENRVILQTMIPEAVLVCYDSNSPDFRAIEKAVSGCSALAAGPGVGQSKVCAQILTMLLSIFEGNKIILDADALNLISKHQMTLPEGCVITPHPKEFARLDGLAMEEILSSPLQNAMKFAANHSVVTLLKGARTVIAAPSGEVRINCTGNDGMATAGSGDVLTGIVGALICLGLSPFEAAALGAHIHGSAGDKAAERLGKPSLMASDIADSIAEVLRKV